MAGRPQKAVSALQDQRPQRMRPTTALAASDGVAFLAPKPPVGVLKETKERWAAFWSSAVARTVLASDHTELYRWAMLCDEWLRAMRSYRRERLVVGSKGQPRRNPMIDVAMGLAAEIRAIEDRFGMNPQSRMRLGIALVAAESALDRLNQGLEGDDDGEPEWVTD